MGYFAQRALDLLDGPHRLRADRARLPHESMGLLKNLLGAFQFSGDETDKDSRALRRRSRGS
jgi:hypothetical protein